MSESFGLINLPTYLIGAFIVVLLPGPSSLFILSSAVRGGVRQGYLALIGIFMGDVALMVAAAAGMASLLKVYPALFVVLKYAGGAYLAWLGVNLLLAAWRGRGAKPAQPDAPPPVDSRPVWRRGLVVGLLNPKSILFCLAFFIQFVDPAYAHKALSFFLLGAMTQLMSFCYMSVLILGGARLAASFRSRHRLRRALTGGTGALFLGFGVKLATAALE